MTLYSELHKCVRFSNYRRNDFNEDQSRKKHQIENNLSLTTVNKSTDQSIASDIFVTQRCYECVF